MCSTKMLRETHSEDVKQNGIDGACNIVLFHVVCFSATFQFCSTSCLLHICNSVSCCLFYSAPIQFCSTCCVNCTFALKAVSSGQKITATVTFCVTEI